MEIKNILEQLKEKTWRSRLPKEYRSFSVEQMDREYQQFYCELEKIADNPTAPQEEMEQLLEKNRRLIKAARIFKRKIQRKAMKQAPRKGRD